MSKEIHLYTCGVDPYVIGMRDIVFVVHQGEPTTPTVISPETPPVFQPTRLHGPYANYIIAPSRATDLNIILEAQHEHAIELGVALTTDEGSGHAIGEQLGAVFDGVSQYRGDDVRVHIVSDDAIKRRGN